MTHHLDATDVSGAAPAPLLRAGIAGLSVALWYSVPDYLHSKGPRAVAKAAVIGGAGVALGRRPARPSKTVISGDEGSKAARPARGAPTSSVTSDRLRKNKPGLVFGVGGALLVAGIGLNIATERWIHRFGSRLARQGTLLPHTAIGLVAGSLTLLAGLDELPARHQGGRPVGSA